MAKCRIGHLVEARVLESLGVDYIDESEVLTPADEVYHLNKRDYTVPFVCGCRDIGEAARRIAEGASMLRTKGEPGTGNIVEAVRHMRQVNAEIRQVASLREDELMTYAKILVLLMKYYLKLNALVVCGCKLCSRWCSNTSRCSVNDATWCGWCICWIGIFKSENPAKFARAIVEATTHYEDYELIASLSKGLGNAMKGIEISTLLPEQRMQERGW